MSDRGAAWEDRLAAVWSTLDDDAPDAFVARLETLLAELPAESPIALFERGSAQDSTGHPERAVPLYEAALVGGLNGLRRRRATIQLASSLRNLGRPARAAELLTAELAAADDELGDAVRAFLALALVDLGRAREAAGIGLGALARHLPRYNRSLARYAAELARGAAMVGPARPQDARAIAEVHVRSWQQAYAALLPAAYLAGLSVDERAAVWREAVTNGEPRVRVARVDAAIVGFAAFGRCRDADAAAERRELWALYLAPEAWSKGIGRALWQAVEAELLADGIGSVSCWVIADNARALAFYAQAGFTVDRGSRNTFRLGDVELEEVRLVRSLDG